MPYLLHLSRAATSLFLFWRHSAAIHALIIRVLLQNQVTIQHKRGFLSIEVVAKGEMAKKVAFLLFPGFEMLDFYGPVSIFGSSKLDGAYQILIVSETAGPVPSSGGVSTVTAYDFDTCPRPDILIIVGELALHTSSMHILCITGGPCVTQHSQD